TVGLSVVLVGGPEDVRKANSVLEGPEISGVANLVGFTKIEELLPIVKSARLVIGGDSLLMQIANITNTPCLNISYPTVNFWETGPRAKGSRVLLFISSNAVDTDRVVLEAKAILGESFTGLPV